MDNIQLTPKSALGGWSAHFEMLTVAELTQLSLVSIAAPNDGTNTLMNAVSKSYSLELPNTGSSACSSGVCILGLQPGQWFLFFPEGLSNPVADVQQKIGDVAHLTDQSDSWVAVQLRGANVQTALERICPIDLEPTVFAVGSVTRTAMEHLGVIIFHSAQDEFILLSARSSAESFKHAIEVSIGNTQN